MCELLLRVRDKTNPDPYLDAQCLKRGDVVAVVEDGWAWSAAERSHPEWRILKLPQVPVAFATALLAGEVDTTGQGRHNRMLRRRGVGLDMAALAQRLGAVWLEDDARGEASRTLELTGVQLWALRALKRPLRDPNTLALD